MKKLKNLIKNKWNYLSYNLFWNVMFDASKSAIIELSSINCVILIDGEDISDTFDLRIIPRIGETIRVPEFGNLLVKDVFHFIKHEHKEIWITCSKKS